MELIKIAGLYKAGYEAYRGISFDPEKRANSIVTSYEEELNNDLKAIPEAEKERYKTNYSKFLLSWLGAMSRCLSPMITGPSNFPTERNRKANDSERKRGDEFREWRLRALKAIAKSTEAAKPEDQKLNERWQHIEKDILSNCQTIIDIDNGNSSFARPLFVSSITGLIQRFANNGETELVNRSLELLKKINEASKKPVISSKNNIWQLQTVAEAAAEIKSDNSKKDDDEFPFQGGKVVLNYLEDRLQIVYDSKPDEAVRATLKKNGFHWSNRNMAWQRQLTNNAKYTASKLLNIQF